MPPRQHQVRLTTHLRRLAPLGPRLAMPLRRLAPPGPRLAMLLRRLVLLVGFRTSRTRALPSTTLCSVDLSGSGKPLSPLRHSLRQSRGPWVGKRSTRWRAAVGQSLPTQSWSPCRLGLAQGLYQVPRLEAPQARRNRRLALPRPPPLPLAVAQLHRLALLLLRLALLLRRLALLPLRLAADAAVASLNRRTPARYPMHRVECHSKVNGGSGAHTST